MISKTIKNETWYVEMLIEKINSKKIIKPQFQRKKKWDLKPKKDNVPNEKSYIEFLFRRCHTVHPITFGQESVGSSIIFSNIDGNNRINAIKHFMDKPFEIFDEYLEGLFKIIDDSKNVGKKKQIKDIFKELSYNDFLKIKRPDRFFKEIEKEELFEEIKNIQNDLDDEIDRIKNKLQINGEKEFHLNVKISINIFEGYTTDELCETFEEINKFNTKLTETELLSCRLFNVCDFEITDLTFKVELQETIKEYYKNKADEEVLECYIYDSVIINAYDFIVGFQNYCNSHYKFIEKVDSQGLALFFKIYKLLYVGFSDKNFTTNNVNDFIVKIKRCCEIFDKMRLKVFTEKINHKLFNSSCMRKIVSLKKNNLYLIFSAIIGYINKKTPEQKIIKSLERALLYHFMISDIKNKENRDELRQHDSIVYEAGGTYIDNMTKIMLKDPNKISCKLNHNLFEKLLEILCGETNNPYQRKLESGSNKNEKRRSLKFFEQTLMFYFYKDKIPTNMLDNTFSIEHIFPNSSEWHGELDKDRTGNLIPIISSVNSSRGNKHIDNYITSSTGKEFSKFIDNIIPSVDEYNKIIVHSNVKSPYIIDNDLFDSLCKKNESTYINCFIKCLFD